MILAKRLLVFLVCLLMAAAARANDDRQQPVLPDVIYKGIVGKALDAVPMDPHERAVLQRSSAVISGTLTGRSLAAWAGLTNPVLLVAGLIWGIYSATNIKPVETAAKPETIRIEPVLPEQTKLASLSGPPAELDAEIAQ